jgi:hypothetical protein
MRIFVCVFQSDVSMSSSATKGLPPGYVWASNGETEPQSAPPMTVADFPPTSSSSLVMSPKRLQVDSGRDPPYATAVASMNFSGRSSMV